MSGAFLVGGAGERGWLVRGSGGGGHGLQAAPCWKVGLATARGPAGISPSLFSRTVPSPPPPQPSLAWTHCHCLICVRSPSHWLSPPPPFLMHPPPRHDLPPPLPYHSLSSVLVPPRPVVLCAPATPCPFWGTVRTWGRTCSGTTLPSGSWELPSPWPRTLPDRPHPCLAARECWDRRP